MKMNFEVYEEVIDLFAGYTWPDNGLWAAEF